MILGYWHSAKPASFFKGNAEVPVCSTSCAAHFFLFLMLCGYDNEAFALPLDIPLRSCCATWFYAGVVKIRRGD